METTCEELEATCLCFCLDRPVNKFLLLKRNYLGIQSLQKRYAGAV